MPSSFKCRRIRERAVKTEDAERTKARRTSASLPSRSMDKVLAFPTVEYAQVSKTLGSGHLEVQCFDGEKRIAHIRGKLRKKVWINPGDVVLLSLRDFQDSRADIILKYTPDEARSLKALGEIPENGTPTFPYMSATINENELVDGNDDIQFEFDEEEIDQI